MSGGIVTGVAELGASARKLSSAYPNAQGQINISLIDLSGETNIRYSPLANLFLKAAIESDQELSGHVRVTLHNFLQGDTTAEMVSEVIAAEPDVIGYSCQGWNFRQLSM